MKSMFWVRRRSVSRIVSALLLLFYMSYYVGVSVFMHWHIQDGVVIKHAHPFAGLKTPEKAPFQSHSHTDSEYLYFGQLSNIVSNEPAPVFGGEKMLFPVYTTPTFDLQGQQKGFFHFCCPVLRGPPFILS